MERFYHGSCCPSVWSGSPPPNIFLELMLQSWSHILLSWYINRTHLLEVQSKGSRRSVSPTCIHSIGKTTINSTEPLRKLPAVLPTSPLSNLFIGITMDVGHILQWFFNIWGGTNGLLYFDMSKIFFTLGGGMGPQQTACNHTLNVAMIATFNGRRRLSI